MSGRGFRDGGGRGQNRGRGFSGTGSRQPDDDFRPQRGGRGYYRGDRGGNRDDRGGYREDRGGYRGDRGGYRGDRGGHSGGGDRSGGYSRGGRGGYSRGGGSGGGGSAFKASQDSGKFLTSNQSNTPTKVQQLNKSSKIMCRPSRGVAGRPIKLVTNYFKLNFKDMVIYHYDLDIKCFEQRKRPEKKKKAIDEAIAGVSKLAIGDTTPEDSTLAKVERRLANKLRKKIFEKWVVTQDTRDCNPIYDGMKNVFTSQPLGLRDKGTFTVDLEEDGKVRQYQLTIQPVEKNDGSNEIELKSLLSKCKHETESLMALNYIMNYRETFRPQIQVGQSFYYLTQPKKMEIDSTNVWFGHYQSVQSTEKGTAVLINLSAKAFHSSGPVINYINKLLGCDITRSEQGLRGYQLRKVTDTLKGVKVQVTHLKYPRKYTIQGISDKSARDMQLSGNDCKPITIAQYFETKYGKLKYPFLQCLHMKSNTSKTYIPFEHCSILDAQPIMKKLDEKVTASMIKETAIKPVDRFRAIEGSHKDVLKESGEKMSEYNLHLDSQFMTADGRVLKKPVLGFSQNGTVEPDDRGVWDLRGNKFYESSIHIKSWILIDFANCSNRDFDKFQDFFLAAGKKVGLNFGEFLGIKQYGREMSAQRALNDAKKFKPAFAVLILSRRDDFHNYDEIKFIADYQLQLVNQCIDSKVLFRFNDQIATNICLKINSKLGGVNHILDQKPKILQEPVMILGADCIHSLRGSACPSIAAVLGSVDEHAFKYELSCRVLENPDPTKISQELILDMKAMVTRLLKFYHDKNNKYPKKLIFFRDGVSEGQFQTVYEQEIPLVQLASRDVIGHIVPITFIVVQKRHQSRFKPQDPREGVGRAGNIPPGTTIDSGIVHPNRFDYFLNSHEGIQGTCRSARYIVLHDDSKYTPDELQQLSYHLCYTYNKCNRSISIPAPVKYADLACYRARKYADFHLLEEEKKRRQRGEQIKLPDRAIKAINEMGECGNSFFFL